MISKFPSAVEKTCVRKHVPHPCTWQHLHERPGSPSPSPRTPRPSRGHLPAASPCPHGCEENRRLAHQGPPSSPRWPASLPPGARGTSTSLTLHVTPPHPVSAWMLSTCSKKPFSLLSTLFHPPLPPQTGPAGIQQSHGHKHRRMTLALPPLHPLWKPPGLD